MDAGDSCFAFCETRLSLALLPAETVDALKAAKAQLEYGLLKYSERFQGIPLAFDNISFPPNEEYGLCFYDQPWVHVNVLASATIMKLEKGTILDGRITKISDTHAAILVYGLFNASISGAEFKRINYAFNKIKKTWDSKSRNESWKEQDRIRFEILSHQHSGGVINIIGSPHSLVR